jgi:quercetin dioxygenase-like cupin family protein
MELKYNEATPQRADDHLLDAPIVHIDLGAYLAQIKEEPSWQDSDRNAITVFKTEGLCLVLTALHQGATMIENTVENLMGIQVLSGEVSVQAGPLVFPMQQGHVLALHPGIPHTVKAITDASLLLTLAGQGERNE